MLFNYADRGLVLRMMEIGHFGHLRVMPSRCAVMIGVFLCDSNLSMYRMHYSSSRDECEQYVVFIRYPCHIGPDNSHVHWRSTERHHTLVLGGNHKNSL